MGYYCASTDCEFFMRLDDIEGALRLLAPVSKWLPAGVDETAVLSVCDTGIYAEKQDLFNKILLDQGYDAGFDGKGNVCSLTFLNEKWYNDTDFFSVFAQYVKKGSYIEFDGEDGERWRVVFDGRSCWEENATISWPRYDRMMKGEYEFSLNAFGQELVEKMGEIHRVETERLGREAGAEVCVPFVNTVEDAAAWFLFAYGQDALRMLDDHAHFEGSRFGIANFKFQEIRGFLVERCFDAMPALENAGVTPALDDVISSCEEVSNNNDANHSHLVPEEVER